MYKRKIEETFRRWKEKEGHKPLIVKGCRQCGKTSSVLDFAYKNYQHVIYLNFHEHKEYKMFFAGALDVDTLVLTISAGIKGAKFVSGKTCLVLDEIPKSLRTVLNHPEHYHVHHALKVGDYNVGSDDSLLTLPFYMLFLVTEI